MLHLVNLEGQIEEQSNWLGVFASALCMVHCIATPIIFVTQMCTDTCCADAPGYWKAIDYIFLAVSFFAVYHSSKASNNEKVIVALWFSWICLTAVILNEFFFIVPLPDYLKYIPGTALIVLHLYNRQFCKCDEDTCCTSK